MAVKTIVHFEIPADDVGRLSKFYRDVFGWKFDLAPMPEMEYWLITTGPAGKSVGGGMYKKMHPRDSPRNFIAVEEIDSMIAAFKKAGGKELVEKMEVPNIGFTFIGADPEGNVIGLHESHRGAARTRPAPKKRGKQK
jgi:predicted enzyme related to lactoylglutathione lyase